ncbi:glycoside hydrolase family 127 protein [Aegicerativicinus sediminis]|uniref:glycoside hydrolase family 127 protein n=1 Tax=Aegicerativicinus sediminis TaxID=2893202 RepID=UPI001E3398A9|nr:glycoside hydrolase family 127 protein [Aegicerativicinus sediminis]
MKNRLKVICFVVLYFIVVPNITAQEKLYPNEFPLEDVTLQDGIFQHARDLNIDVLLKYDVDRLLAPYRKEAGLQPKASSYPNWDGLDGHIGGHYLSAMAMNYASTGNSLCKDRMDYMIDELKQCAQSNRSKHPDWGKGYVGGVPNSAEIWSSLQKGNLNPLRRAWVPWYNLHKTYAGLRDAWLYANDKKAKDLFLNFCDWGIEITSSLSEEEMQKMLDIEHGGMNEIFADAYQMTGDDKYITAAKRFSHHDILFPMAEGVDNLDNKHANTQVPKAVGFERIGELSKDSTYLKAGEFLWETVTDNRSLAFGGNSRKEHFPSVSASIDFVNEIEGPESCNTYNMLKLSEDLFRVNPEAKYVDFYERSLYNHILSTQHPRHGGYVYFTPTRPRHYRVYSVPNEGMWCCVGSGMENHGKYSQFIYTHSKGALYLNLFVASELNWEEKGIKIKQETEFPFEESSKLTIIEGTANFPLMIRYPSWVEKGALKISVNGKAVDILNSPSSYIEITRNWKKGDIVEIYLPMKTTTEQLPNVPNYKAFMHGPIVLAAKTGSEQLEGLLADDSRWAHIAHGELLPIDKAPIIIEEDLTEIGDKLIPVPGEPLKFKTSNLNILNGENLILEPFFQLHDSRYMMYWLTLSPEKYEKYVDSLAQLEKAKLNLERRTIDYVGTGEQQPESDHFMQTEKSNSGNAQDQFWRDAYNGGYFSYQMKTDKKLDLSLLVRYWGFEWSSKNFKILIDDEEIASVNTENRNNTSQFKEASYQIPNRLLKGKEKVRVKFQAEEGSGTSQVYFVRIIENE